MTTWGFPIDVTFGQIWDHYPKDVARDMLGWYGQRWLERLDRTRRNP